MSIFVWILVKVWCHPVLLRPVGGLKSEVCFEFERQEDCPAEPPLLKWFLQTRWMHKGELV